MSDTLLRILLLRDVPFWAATPRRRWARRLAALLALYAGVLIVLLWLENRLLFAGATFYRTWHEPPADLSVREVDLTVAGGGTVQAWFTAPEGWKPEQGAVLFSHGNGSNLSTRGEVLRKLRDHLKRAVLGHSYPGYGKSTGRPSEEGCYAAGDAAWTWLVEEAGVPRREIVLVGESMGGATAIDLATRHEHRMLLTLAAFTSFPDMAQANFPWLPGRYFVRTQFDNLAKIGRVKAPAFLAHGTADGVVPFAQGQRLAAAAAEPKRVYVIEGGSHNVMFPEREGFWDAVRAFLEATKR